MKEELKAFYFPHDIGASNDPKLIDLRMRFGWEAIGMYWAIIEALHKEENGSMPSHLITSMIQDFYNQEEIRTMSHKKQHAKDLEECLYTNVLLERYDGITTNRRVRKNIEERKRKSDLAKKSIDARWHKTSNSSGIGNNTDVIRTNYERNTIKERKGKEIKDIQPLFEQFYSKYPKKQGKAVALKAFTALAPNDELLGTILSALDVHAKTEQWTKDGGKFIPLPATWLRGMRWEDEIRKTAKWIKP
jgi:hypothetical protein